MNKNDYASFIDYSRAFDRVWHDKLINILKKPQVDEWVIRIVKNLYNKFNSNWKHKKCTFSGNINTA